MYPLYVVDVPAGVTNAFSSSDSLAVVTLDNDVETTNTISYTDFNAETSGTLIKAGPGVLKPDVTIANFNGQIHVEEGVLYITKSGQRGACIPREANVYPTDDNAVFVASGATLVMDSSGLAQNVATENKKVVIAGGGAPGEGGALVARKTRGAGNNEGWHMGPNLTLSGDATMVNAIYTSGRLTFRNGDTPSPILDLAGHTLTIVAGDGLSLPDFNHNNRPITAGNLIFDNVLYHIQGAGPLQGTSENYVKLRNASAVQMEYMAGIPRDSTLVVEDDTVFNVSCNTHWMGYGDISTNANLWSGAVELGGNVVFRNKHTGTSECGFTFGGAVSGTGGFVPHRKTAETWTGKQITLHLVNPLNSFTGSVSLDEDTVTVHNSGALPPEGAGIGATNSALRLTSASPYDLPGAYFYGTGTVSRGTGRWRRAFVKDGDGRFDYFSAVGGPLLDIRGGTVRFAAVPAGLYEGTALLGGATPLVNAVKTGTDTYTNSVYLGTELCYFRNGGDQVVYWSKLTLFTYTGYIWNRSGADENWTFASVIGGNSSITLKIDGEYVIQGADNGIRSAPITVSPGAHAFELRLSGTKSGNGESWCGPAYTNNTAFATGWNWGFRYREPYKSSYRAFGLGLDRRGGTSLNMDDYIPLMDPGDGSLFTLSTNEEDIATLCLPSFDKASFAAGTALDLNGHAWKLAVLEGFPVVSNGSLSVTQKWEVASSRLVSGEAMDVDGTLSLGEEAVVEISDPQLLSRSVATGSGYTLAVADAVSVPGRGKVLIGGEPSRKWSAVAVGANSGRMALKLVYSSGTMLVFR